MTKSRRKHPKYRKEMDIKEKKKLKDIKDKTKQNSIINRLYELPLDIKIKIFQMAVLEHMYTWCDNFHIKHMIYLEEFFSNIWWLNQEKYLGFSNTRIPLLSFDHDNQIIRQFHEQNNELWKVIDFTYLKDKRLCVKNVDIKGQPNIQSIYIDPNIIESNTQITNDLRVREWSNIPSKFWIHKKCRCSTCDKIRILGYSDLPDKDKRKYARIKMINSNQWKTKTVTQHKMEKEKNRKRKINQ
tara:strand:- start:1625 stop:2350 length:726 start_codon:yes stop_codon:yes gene_type:complete